MFQKQLYQLRKGRGISQEELAAVVGVSRQAVQKWEAGTSRPDMDNLLALSRYFGVSLDELVTGEAPSVQEAAPLAYLPYWHYEYKSRRTLFGLPLVHINLGHRSLHRAKGVLAIGNVATGILAVGGIAVGLLSLGCASLGILGLGAIALGVVTFGGLSAGILAAVGGLAVSFGLAIGGAAFSASYALGGAAVAGKIAAGGAATGAIAIGDAVSGATAFPKELWNSGTAQAISAAIHAQFPETPALVTRLVTAFLH